MSNRLIAFPYYGGKSIHLSWLLPRLPQSEVYVEPFGGSAAVLLNREPSEVEIYNDLNGSVVNFFRVLRESKEELLEQLRTTLYAREEYDICRESMKHHEVREQNKIEWARCFFVGIRQSFMSTHYGGWVLGDTKVRAFKSGIKGLDQVYDRLRDVQIDNIDGLVLVKKFDRPEVFQYQDPPYLLSTRNDQHGYELEMTEEQHTELAEFNLQAKCKVAISGYISKLYTELYEDNDWIRVDAEYTIGGMNKGQGKRTESLWCNYDPYSVRQGHQTGLDEFFGVFNDE